MENLNSRSGFIASDSSRKPAATGNPPTPCSVKTGDRVFYTFSWRGVSDAFQFKARAGSRPEAYSGNTLRTRSKRNAVVTGIWRSLIEAWWRSLKHQWLYLNSLQTVSMVRNLVEFYVTEHNGRLPHSAFQGQTPDEMYFGPGDQIPRDLENSRKAARQARLNANRALCCQVCEVRQVNGELEGQVVIS